MDTKTLNELMARMSAPSVPASTARRNSHEMLLSTRYASKQMAFVFSDNFKFINFRRLWLILAKAQKQLGLTQITDAAISEMEANLYNIDYDVAEAEERRLRHDVMAHVHTFAKCCPSASPIIHLGATSCYVACNADLIAMSTALSMIESKLVILIDRMTSFAASYRALATLGSTHFQPAQPTTVGKRATIWLQDFEMDLQNISRARKALRFRGAKGTTGTQASFLALFDNDHSRVEALDRLVAEMAGMPDRYRVTGQTYPRKVDFELLSTLASIGVSAHRVATDVRLLSGLQELEEPFEKSQIGSSAMAYKRNPMRCERVCSLARYVQSLPSNASATASVQWLERSLDDSAIRRLSLPAGFLATEAFLTVLINVFSGLVVHPNVVAARLRAELPFMATENIIMAMVRRGADRQECHEHIRQISILSRNARNESGESTCDLVERIRAHEYFAPILSELDSILDPSTFVGRAPEQVDSYVNYIRQEVLVGEYKSILDNDSAARVAAGANFDTGVNV